MKINKDGSISLEIKGRDCEDAILFERMLGYDRDKTPQQMRDVLSGGKVGGFILTENGNIKMLDEDN